MRRALLPAAVILFAGLVVPRFALAQGENAASMRGGTFRLSLGGEWAHFTERFGTANPLRPNFADGTPERIDIDFSAESLGVTQLAFLGRIQDSLRALSGVGAFGMNLGRHNVTLSASVRHQPIKLMWAPTSRLVLGVSVPLVRARTSTFVLGPDSAAAATATRGNVGFSAEFVTPGSMNGYRTEADAALAALANTAANGPPALQAQAAAELAAIRPIVCGLSTLATASASDPSSPCFVAGAAGPSVLLPVAGTPVGDSLTTRLQRAQTSYAATRTAFAAQGVTLPPFTALFTLPGAALDSVELRRFMTDPNAPLAADSLSEVVRTGLGDMEVGGWFQIADGNSLRSQLQVMVRLPTGTVDRASSLHDIGTGDHQMDVEVALRNDIVFNRHLWLHAGGLYGVQMADQLERRVAPWYLPLAPLASTAMMERDLGDYYAIDVVPNWQLDETIGVGIGWHYFHQGATTWSYTDPADEARVGLPAGVLGEATSVSRMRIGAGVTFNTLPRFMAGRARLPYRVTWSYNSTIWGEGGQVPKAGVMRLEIQAFFGNLR